VEAAPIAEPVNSAPSAAPEAPADDDATIRLADIAPQATAATPADAAPVDAEPVAAAPESGTEAPAGDQKA